MLFRYRNEYQKIALDMLSLVPGMGRMNRLKAEFNWYQNAENRVIYLWRDNNDNWAGLLGIEESLHNVVVRIMVLTPGYLSKSNYCKMLDQLAQIYVKKRIVSSLQTVHFFKEWEESKRINEE